VHFFVDVNPAYVRVNAAFVGNSAGLQARARRGGDEAADGTETADTIRARISDVRIIVASFAIAAAGFALVGAQAGFAVSVAGFALIGVGTGPIVPCGFALAARQSEAGPATGLASASLFSTLTRLPAPLATGAIAQLLSLPAAFAAFALAFATTAAATAAFASTGPARSPHKG
jgi:hypothetical protein